MGERDRPVDRLDDIREAGVGRRPGEREAAETPRCDTRRPARARWFMSFATVGTGMPVWLETWLAASSSPSVRAAAVMMTTP
jgi:hypothetical protein